jgi:hypothetical protein
MEITEPYGGKGCESVISQSDSNLNSFLIVKAKILYENIKLIIIIFLSDVTKNVKHNA